MRLPNEEYKKAVNCLKRYNYNCIKIMTIREDIMSISGLSVDGMPKAKYTKSDMVLNSVIQLQEDVELKNAIKEVKAVQMALQLVSEESNIIFEELFRKGTDKYTIINNILHTSEETYKRRKRELIYTTYEEFSKIWPFFDTFSSKNSVIILMWIGITYKNVMTGPENFL